MQKGRLHKPVSRQSCDWGHTVRSRARLQRWIGCTQQSKTNTSSHCHRTQSTWKAFLCIVGHNYTSTMKGSGDRVQNSNWAAVQAVTVMKEWLNSTYIITPFIVCDSYAGQRNILSISGWLGCKLTSFTKVFFTDSR